MWTFFFYVKDPVATLTRLAAQTRVKLLADVNPRQTPIDEAVAAVRAAGLPVGEVAAVLRTADLPTVTHRGSRRCESPSAHRWCAT